LSAIAAAKSAVFVLSGEQITMRSIFRIAVGMIVCVSRVLGDDAFSGRDAAYIDWGVKNCEAESTDKEHALIEQANKNARSNFLEQYSNESNKLSGSFGAPKKQENICADIREWYGALGSRIPDLLRWKQEPRSEGETKSAAGTSAKRKGKRSPGPH
jgi:hypothetical protein